MTIAYCSGRILCGLVINDDLKDIIEPGTVIGFHIAIDDADDNIERDLQITWSSFEAHDQLHFGDLVFGEPLAVSPASALTATWGQMKEQEDKD